MSAARVGASTDQLAAAFAAAQQQRQQASQVGPAAHPAACFCPMVPGAKALFFGKGPDSGCGASWEGHLFGAL